MTERNDERDRGYRGRGRDDEEQRDPRDGYDSGSARHGQASRWGSGDYRQNRERDGRWEAGRPDYESRGAYSRDPWERDDFSGRASGGGYAGYDPRAPEGGGYGRADNERGAEFGGNYGRSAGTSIYRSDYTSGETGAVRTRGMSGNYLSGGGGYGTARDVENLSGQELGMNRGTERPSYRGRGPKGFQRTDERLRELVCERLHDHHDVDATDIDVTVSDGEVTLAGTVADRHTKMLAEDLAESVSGVKDVHNSLKVDRGFFSRMADKLRDATTDRSDSSGH